MTRSKPIEINSSDLPQGWCVSSIGEISLYIQRGKSPAYTEKSDLPVVNQKCVRWDGIDRAHLKFIHPDQFDKWSSERYLVNGDILWNSTGTGTIGRAALVQLSNDERMVADSHLTIIRPSTNVTAKYIHYWIMSSAVQNSIGVIQSGSTNQVELSKSAVESTPIPLAPLEQQKLIVSKIEELFSHIDAGVEGLKQTKAKLQQYRQSVLKDAVTGKLTEKWREQNADKLEPADQLLDRILAERRANWEQEQLKAFAAKGSLPKDDKWKEKYKVVDSFKDSELSRPMPLPEGWSYVKLGQLIEDPSYGTSKKCTYDLKGKGVLRIPNIVAGEINSEDMKYAEFTKEEISTYQLKKGDILTIRSNGSVSLVGKCAVVSEKDTDFLFAGYLIRLRPLLAIVDPYYLQFVLMSGFLRKQIETLAKSSSGVNNINSGELQSLIIPICSLAEQNFISQNIDSKELIISRQFEQYEKLLIKASRSKSSILSKAFSGKLLKNDYATETAEDLLERILEEKQLQKVKINLVNQKPKARAKKMEKRPVFDVIKEAKKSLKVDEIFELAGFNNDVSPEGVEAFYQELKEVSARDEIKVTPFFLDKKKQGDKFEYKEVGE